MKKPKPKEILFGYQNAINLKSSTEKYFKPLWHFHSEYEFVYIEQSTGKKFIGDHIGKFKKGDLYFLGRRLPHMWVNNKSYFKDTSTSIASSLVLHFNLSFLDGTFLESEICKELNKLLVNSERGLHIIGKSKELILQKLNEFNDKKGLELYSTLIEILQVLLTYKEYSILSSAGYVNSFIHDNSERINTINEFVTRNFRENITLTDVAELAHMNVTSFCRYFKMKTKQSFNQYLIDFRIGSAKRLLIHTDLSISQICYEIGFNNIANFNRHFKKKTLLTPKTYRKTHGNPK